MYKLVSNARLIELIQELTEELNELRQEQVLYTEVSEELKALVNERRIRQTLGEMV
jgi:hypothetical protein